MAFDDVLSRDGLVRVWRLPEASAERSLLLRSVVSTRMTSGFSPSEGMSESDEELGSTTAGRRTLCL